MTQTKNEKKLIVFKVNFTIYWIYIYMLLNKKKVWLRKYDQDWDKGLLSGLILTQIEYKKRKMEPVKNAENGKTDMKLNTLTVETLLSGGSQDMA